MYFAVQNVVLHKIKFTTMKSLKELMPEIYFEVMDKEDFAEHEMYLNKIIDPDNHTKIFKQKGDIEEFVFYNFDLKRLKNKILKVVSNTKNNVLMYRVFPNTVRNEWELPLRHMTV